MANILNILGEVLTSGFIGGRTDRYTRPLHLDNNGFFRGFLQDKESYVTISNNEFNLYKTTAELFIGVNKKASMLSNGIFRIKDLKTDKIIENHPLLSLLEKPNPLMNRNMWLMDICVNYELYGDIIIYKNKGSRLSEYPSVLMNLPNSELKIIRTGKIWKASKIEDIIEKFVIQCTNEEFKPNEVIRIKTTNVNDPVTGLSPLHAIQQELSNIRGAKGFRNVNITKRGALGLLSPGGKDTIGAQTLGDEQKQEVERSFVSDHGIFDNQTPIKFVNAQLNYQHLGFAIKDNMLFEEVSADFMRIIDNLGLNENIFSKEKGSTYANLIEGLKMSYQDSIIPFSELLSYALNDGLDCFEKGIYIELDYSHLPCLKDNEYQKAQTKKLKSEAFAVLVKNGWEPNKAAEFCNIDPEFVEFTKTKQPE